jgi:hypothetical protein
VIVSSSSSNNNNNNNNNTAVVGAVPARCWKEPAETSHAIPLRHSPTHCRWHSKTPQRLSELYQLWHAMGRVAQVSSPLDLLHRSWQYILLVSLHSVQVSQSCLSHLLGRVGRWVICRLNVNWLGLWCDLGVWRSIIKGTLYWEFIHHTPGTKRAGIPFVPVVAEQSRFYGF